jgi:hypothetical protein
MQHRSIWLAGDRVFCVAGTDQRSEISGFTSNQMTWPVIE